MTYGNTNYGSAESQAIIDEYYNTLKSVKQLTDLIIPPDKECAECIEENLKKVEKDIDRKINDDPALQTTFSAIFHRRNIMIPMHKATEKNEAIDAKKRLIKEILNVKD